MSVLDKDFSSRGRIVKRNMKVTSNENLLPTHANGLPTTWPRIMLSCHPDLPLPRNPMLFVIMCQANPISFPPQRITRTLQTAFGISISNDLATLARRTWWLTSFRVSTHWTPARHCDTSSTLSSHQAGQPDARRFVSTSPHQAHASRP